MSEDAKFKLANRAQRAEIFKHRDRLVREWGRLVSLDEAAMDWIRQYAASWRQKFEATCSEG